MASYLRRGISGFRHMGDDPLPVCDLGEFRSFCYSAAREAECSIKHVGRRPQMERNFTTGVFVLPQDDIAALRNLHFPVVGFAKALPDEESCELEFVDCEQLASLFKNLGRYEVLSKFDLEQPVTPEEYDQLSAAEIEQVAYWKPSCIGQVIFNYWD